MITITMTDQEAHMLITILIAGRSALTNSGKKQREMGFDCTRSELAADYSAKLSTEILRQRLEAEKSYALSSS